VAAAVAIGHAHGATPRPVRVVVVGDSIAAALAYQPSMERAVAKGFNVKFDLQVCRRLASAGCPYNGGVPSSALDAVRAAGRGIGDVLVVDVGYNDDPTVYGRQMAEVIRTAKAGGVKQIVWVNLRETEPGFTQINAVIRAEAQRFPLVHVADWSSWSDGKPWFRPDGLHLTDAGADALALMLRVYIVSAARAAAATP
jgi:lysophospholipase L1-like esterase